MFHDIHLGVTGLRRSGKTVFLTRLLYQLEQLGSRNLDAFENKGIRLFPGKFLKTKFAKPFPYQDHLHRLRSHPPDWPQPSVEECQCVIEFRYKASSYGPLKKGYRWLLGNHKDAGTIRLHIHDYPGEYLLDVPMLKLSYADWSKATIEQMYGQLAGSAHDYEEATGSIVKKFEDSGSDADIHGPLEQLRSQYRAYIESAGTAGLKALPPGMTFAAWDKQEQDGNIDSLLPFVPIPASVARSGRLAAALADQYSAYQKNRVKPFVSRLARSTRQLVLVDVLRVLRNGLDCYNDTRRCLVEIIGGYTYNNRLRQAGNLDWLPPRTGLPKLTHMVLNPGINRTVFVATKADHVLVSHRTNLEKLLEELVGKAGDEISGYSAKIPEFEHLSAIRATGDTETMFKDRPTDCLFGIKKGESRVKKHNPGTVPAKWPEPKARDEWAMGDKRFEFPEFLPPTLPLRDGATWPEMNLDRILWSLLKDCFHVSKTKLASR